MPMATHATAPENGCFSPTYPSPSFVPVWAAMESDVAHAPSMGTADPTANVCTYEGTMPLRYMPKFKQKQKPIMR